MHKPFQWQNPYPTSRIPVFGRNIVSTSHPYAAQAGLKILHEGGNAIDAAIAAAAAITICEPVSCGLGSDAFAIVWDGHSLHGLNASGHSAQAWSPEYFAGKYGVDQNGLAKRPKRGWDSVTVPGAIAGWEALHQKFGALPWHQVLAPAIEIAARGYAVPPVVAYKWAAAIPELKDQAGFADCFMPLGRAPHVGERFTMPSAAKTLERLALHGAKDYYQGQIAEQICHAAKENGAALSLDDLASYRPDWVTPISKNYRGYDVHEIPPNGQGIAALIALGILEHFDIGNIPVDSSLSQHLQIEAMKLAFSDLYAHVADPSSMQYRTEDFLDPDYLRARAKLIDPDHAMPSPQTGIPRLGGTIYLSTADESGRMVSFIQSNYMGFGSGVVVPGTGISLQNRGFAFSSDPRSANVVAGRKRPFHTIIPGFLTKTVAGHVQPVMSFGVMGADMQPQGHLQTLVRMLDYQQQPQAACDAPRWKVNRDYTLDVESNMNAQTVNELIKKGHQLKRVDDPYMDFGAGQFIWRLSNELEDGYVAASDSRRDGHAASY